MVRSIFAGFCVVVAVVVVVVLLVSREVDDDDVDDNDNDEGRVGTTMCRNVEEADSPLMYDDGRLDKGKGDRD